MMTYSDMLRHEAEDLPEHLEASQIAELWTNGTNPEKSSDLRQTIETAVLAGKLKAEVAAYDPQARGNYEVITSPTLRSQIRDGWLNDTYVISAIHRDAFRSWLQAAQRWPLPDGCLLQRWFSDSPPKSRTKRKATRQDRLTGAIQRALSVLRVKLQCEPTADEVFSYLADSDETGVICDSGPDKLVWVDARGKLHDTQRKSLANRLSRLR